ncbi:pseudouridine synthase [Cenococcum geophilum 1.58]|uniref:pseudouridine synthase n=1 Tax=Cenococcum geophilum 1.58 TaxID=794803 RepID=UPI00358F1C99|nr:pseudouridine synthase [Cenococcum geophilum 1.58]
MMTRKEPQKIVEGIFAIHKPPTLTSADVLRNLQTHFNPSVIFSPWLRSERARLKGASASRHKINQLQVKLGHGGTLDPLATGVLIVGVGRGTKCLKRFLECTKTYECVVLFGAATDTCDAVGKVVSRAEYAHITRGKVEEALEKFRGKIMQKPPVFSALRVGGKRSYELARAGVKMPEIKAREVEVKELEMVDWMEGGCHGFQWPKEEVGCVEEVGEENDVGIRDVKDGNTKGGKGVKRRREGMDECVSETASELKRPKMEPEPVMSGALPLEEALIKSNALQEDPINPRTTQAEKSLPIKGNVPASSDSHLLQSQAKPPAACLRMTVTSGFYVRSLCHDLGLAVDSLGLMSSLIRYRQGDYELGRNVLEYEDLEKGENVWGPKVKGALEDFMTSEGWEAENASAEDEELELEGRGQARVKNWNKNRRRDNEHCERKHDRKGDKAAEI